MVGHTKGPWSIEAMENGDRCIYAGEYGIGEAWDLNGNPENVANAHLIAAAPELLEALKALVADEWYGMDDEDLQYELSQGNEMVRPYISARAAIAKAEGK